MDGAGKRLGSYGGLVAFLPGTYQLDLNGSKSGPISVEAGELKEIRAGAIHYKGSYDIYDDSGKRLGNHRKTLALMPGRYRVVVREGAYEKVVVKAGEITKLK